MINILVTLEVKDFHYLEIFEGKAVEIMNTHGASVIIAFETFLNTDGSGQEIHLLEFPSDSEFSEYRSGSRLLEHVELRNKVILSTVVVKSRELKKYI